MPTLIDISRFLGGQSFGTTTLPSVDLTGKTIVVTGSNTGLGYECVKHLVQMKVSKAIIACRNTSKGEVARTRILKDIPEVSPSTIEVWEVDLSTYKSVIAFGQRVSSTLSRLDGLVANAGVENFDFTTAQGLETTITINVVSTILTALSILPKLEETASKFNVQTTLSLVGSMVHTFGPDTQLDIPSSSSILDSLSDPKTADMNSRYNLSKLMEHMCFHQLARRVTTRNQSRSAHAQVVVNIVNPGWCASELGRNKTMGAPAKAMFAMIGRTAEEGGRTLVHAVSAGPETHDKYLSECQIKPESAFMRSERADVLSAKLWAEVADRLGQVAPDIVSVAA